MSRVNEEDLFASQQKYSGSLSSKHGFVVCVSIEFASGSLTEVEKTNNATEPSV